MKNLFEQSRSHWVRYDHYELKTAADGKRYITPAKDAKPDVYNPMKEMPGMVLEKPTIYWDFHSLLLGIQMMFSFMLVDEARPLRLCKHCQKVFMSSRANAVFCSARCKNQYNVYKSRGKQKEQDGDENA